MRAEYHLNPGQMPLLTELLGKRVDLEIDGPAGTFTMRPKQEPAQREAPEPMDQAGLEIAHALHTLWTHGQPSGERADFSEMELNGLDFTGMRFPGVSFAGAALDGCCFQLADLMGAGFAYAALRDCDFRFTDTEGVDFSQAEITNCEGLDDISQGPLMTMGG